MDSGSLVLLVTLSIIFILPVYTWRIYQQLLTARKEVETLKRSMEVLDDKSDELEAANKVLTEQNSDLSRYQPIVDIQAEVQKAKDEAKDIRQRARDSLERAESKATSTVSLATQQSDEILQQARDKAEFIAGDALVAKENAAEFEKTAKAMKNIIEGYGDEYLVPNHSAIDDLADEYDHKKAGQDLKEARASSKGMIKHGTAADCDYVEAHRRKTAIEFVLDAFNGKVESILSKVRHDNYGKLEQEIRDAYQTVNHNGAAFRSARINELYLSARLRELKWAVATNELKLQEREEQRQIREQMREEEKARKEIEKAIRDAEKEEKMLQKAMEKARKELAAASELERAKWEHELNELTGKLHEAEAKNKRALSMAQQTRRGHVYIISNEGSFGDSVLKIGMTRRLEPMDRVKELGDASVPFPFDVHAIINSEDAPSLESELHRRFDGLRLNKVNTRKEFFQVTIAEVKQVIEALNFEVHWTMKAEALEYRESRAMALQNQKKTEEPLLLA